eukprot:350897-Chlamydomonas_euryale.AAC.6
MSSGQQYAGAMGPANAAGGEAANMQALAASSKPKERKKPKRKVLTSLLLEIFIYFGYLWDAFYYPVNILVFIYKGESVHPTAGASLYSVCCTNLRSILPQPEMHSIEKPCSKCARNTQESFFPTQNATSQWSSASHGSGSSLKSLVHG